MAELVQNRQFLLKYYLFKLAAVMSGVNATNFGISIFVR